MLEDGSPGSVAVRTPIRKKISFFLIIVAVLEDTSSRTRYETLQVYASDWLICRRRLLSGSMVKCVVSADDDRNGPAAFSDAGCTDQYGEGFGCDCSFEGKNSICPGPTGCHNMPNPNSECIVPDSIYAPCGRPACAKGWLTCDMGGGPPGSCR